MYQIGIISAVYHPHRDPPSPGETSSIRSGSHGFPYPPTRFPREAGPTPRLPVTVPPPASRFPDGVPTAPRAPINRPRAPTRVPWDAVPSHGRRPPHRECLSIRTGSADPPQGRHPFPTAGRHRAGDGTLFPRETARVPGNRLPPEGNHASPLLTGAAGHGGFHSSRGKVLSPPCRIGKERGAEEDSESLISCELDRLPCCDAGIETDRRPPGVRSLDILASISGSHPVARNAGHPIRGKSPSEGTRSLRISPPPLQPPAPLPAPRRYAAGFQSRRHRSPPPALPDPPPLDDIC